MVKEIRFHPNTDTHDMEFKCRHLREFLIQGHKVKATIIFIGRMMVHQDIGRRLMDEILEKLSEVGKVEQPPKMEGRYMTAMLIPDKKKIDDLKKLEDRQKNKSAKSSSKTEIVKTEENKPEQETNEAAETQDTAAEEKPITTE